MSANICNICGANLIYKDGKWVCPACGAFKTEEISNEEVTLLYNAAQKLRLASFDDAEEAYRDIIAKYPENSEAHWGLVLSKYGIKYEDDYDGKKLPTCYATSIESVLTDKDYLDAVRLCKDKYQKEYYIEQGKVLEKIRVEWLEKASKEPKYDVFLCFKDSDKLNNMERTDDSIEVANLYTHLSSLGYKVFYSRESLRDKVAEKYEPYIYNALNTAAVMIVYGSKIEYFSSVWMKNEWTRYVRRLREGLKIDGSLIIACDGANPGDLPRPLNQMQVLDARKKTFYGDLEAHIAKIISIARRPKATVERVEISSAIGKKKASIDNQIKTIKVGGGVGKKTPVVIDNAVSVREIGRYEVPALTPDEDTKLKSINLFLQKELFDNAKKVVDEILEKNKYNGQALLADLLIRYKVKSIDGLSDKIEEIEDFSQFNTVIEYNDKYVGEKLIAVIGQKIRLAVANSNYNVAIACLKEIVVYNSAEVLNIKLELRKTATRLLAVSANTAAEIFDVLVNSYQDSETYIEYIQGFVDDCIKNRQFTVAQKYNDKIIELDDGNLKATFSQAYIYVQATSFDNFITLADRFVDFKLFDNAIKHFDEDDTVECFSRFRKIVVGLIVGQKSGNAIADWFDFVVKYEFDGRNEFIEETINSLPNIKDLTDRAKLFDRTIMCIDGSDVERHISMRLSFAKKLQATGTFALANKYYNEVIEIEEGNLDALWGIILCNIGALRETDIAQNIENFSYFKELETLLKYCPDMGIRAEYLDKLVNAVLFKSASICNEESINKLAKIFDGIIKYYPEECNEILIKHLQKFADNCKNSSAFSLAEKYYAMVLAIDNMKHEAYWGLLQAKLNCRNNDDLIKQKKTISELSEFSSAIAAASNDERSADKYASIAKNQIDYWENQKKKDIAKKRKKKKIAIFSSITAAVLVIAIVLAGVFQYIKIEKDFKFFENESGYTIDVGKYYKESNVEIPATYNGKPVTKISDGMFENDTNITTITLSSNITYIGNNAFKNCSNLKQIIFKSARTYSTASADTHSGSYAITTLAVASSKKDPNNNIAYIGESAFYNCVALERIDVSSATTIGKNAFYGCSKLESVSLNDNLTKLADSTFNGCLKLNNLQLPSALTEIGANCFVNCQALENIAIPATTTTVGANILNGCTGLKKIVLEDREENLSGFDNDWKSGIPDTVELKIGFRISLDYNGATSGNTGSTRIVVVDESYTLPVPKKAGYSFVGWYDGIKDANKLTDENGKSVGAYEKYESISAYAIWEANLNEIVFNANGGEGEMDNQKVATDATVALNECLYTKKGYTFAGWGTTTNGEVNYSDKADYMMGTNALYILYAIWTPNNNTLHFESNGGSGKMSDIIIATDAKEKLSANAFTKTGYDFAGWAETENGSKVYSDGDSYTMGTENATLYALWTPKAYKITYNLNGGQLAVQNKATYNIETSTFTLNNPTKRGYEFKGWSGSNLTGNENQAVSIETGTYGELTFTANWTAIEYSITYNLNEGTNNSANPKTYTIEQEVRLQDPERKGYRFSGWTDNGLISKDSIGEKTFTASWESIKYAISYDMAGGENNPSNPTEYTIEDDQIALAQPSRKGYSFKNWSNDGVIPAHSTGNKSFTAYWEANVNTITFDANGGLGIMDSQQGSTDSSIILSANTFTRKGYVFSGWSKSKNGDVTYADRSRYVVSADADQTLYAVWTPSLNTLIFNGNGNTSGTMDDMHVHTNETMSLTKNLYEKTGYSFVGWSTSSTGKADYLDCSDYIMGDEDSYTLYAVWKINQYTITLELNGGTSSISSITKDYNAPVTARVASRQGYTFDDWYADAKFVDVYNFTTMPAENITVYAKWSMNTTGDAQTGIRTISELQSISTHLDGNFYLENDIDATGFTFKPIGSKKSPFAGSFDGRGLYINNLRIENKTSDYDTKYTGVFGYNTGTIANLYIKNAYYTGTQYTGGIAGYSETPIKDSGFNGDIRASSTYVGGIVGYGAVERCYALGTIYQSCSVEYCGGISGYGDLKNCYGNNEIEGSYGYNGQAPSCGTLTGNGDVENSYEGKDSRFTYQWNTVNYLVSKLTGFGQVVNSYEYWEMKNPNRKNMTEVCKWDENAWCFGYGLPVLYGNEYIRVIYNNVEGLDNDSNPSGYKKGSDGFILAEPKKAGYAFGGWFTDEEYVDAIKKVDKINKTITLYAKWVPLKYTATLNPASGNVMQTSATIEYDSTYALEVPTRQGYSFAGWYSGTGNSAMRVTNEEGFCLDVWTFLEDISLYARWNGSEGLQYTDSGYYYTITGVADKSVTELYIPEYYNDKIVAAIGENAFEGCNNLKHVYVVGTIDTIGKGAFSGCSALTRLLVPFVGESRTATQEKGLLTYWFGQESADNTEEILQSYLDSGEVYQTYSAYVPLSLTNIKVFDTTRIPYGAFSYMSKLQNVSFDGVSEIEERAFEYATGISTFDLPDTLKSIGANAFAHTSIKDITIPSSVQSIGEDIFAGCKALAEMKIPFVGQSAEATEYNAVLGWLFGQNNYDGMTATTQGSWTSYISAALKTVEITNASTVPEYAFANIKTLKNVVLANTITKIKDNAFRGCTGLTNIDLHLISTIGGSAFYECSGLTSVNLESATSIGSNAFFKAYSLESVDFSDNLTTIGGSAFYACKIGKIEIPSSIVSIGSYAFEANSVLRTIIIKKDGAMLSYSSDMLKGLNNYAKIYVPDGLLAAYKSNSSWKALGVDKFYGLSIVKSNGMAISGNTLVQYFGTDESVTIPSSISNILPYAFYRNSFVRRIVIPGTITSISDHAFYGCDNLETVKLMRGTTQISSYAFAENALLQSINLPDTLVSIGTSAFDNCDSLQAILLPKNLQTIGDYAFRNTQLSTVIVHNNVTSIGVGAFQGCPLESITLPFVGGSRDTNSSVEKTASRTDNGSSYLFGYIFGTKLVETMGNYTPSSWNGLIYQGQQSYRWNPEYYWNGYYISATLKSVTITDATGISANAFYGCTMIESLTLNEGITAIYNKAFYNCTALKSMSLPSSVRDMGSDVFYGCSNMTGITLPETLTEIGDYAFSGCVGLTGITIPNTVTRIGDYAFSRCTGITELTLPNGLQTIGQEAFKNMQLSTVIVHNNVTSIGVGAFQGCPLESITLPFVGANHDSKTSVDSSYYTEKQLLGYIFGTTLESTSSNGQNLVYQGQSNNSGYRKYYIPSTLKTVTITDATGISANAFYGCTMIESLTLNEGITTIYDKAFYNCTALKSMSLPSSVRDMGSDVFYGCSNMTGITLPETLTEIGDYAFSGCVGLTGVIIPNTVTRIGDYAFSRCSKLKIVEIANGNITDLTVLGSNVFSNTHSSLCIIVPQDALKAYKEAANWSSYASKIIADNNIVENAFLVVDGVLKQYIGNNETVNIPANITSIGNYAFAYSNVKNVTIGDSVTDIGDYAFYSCSALKSVTYGTGLSTIGNYAFAYCVGLQSVTIGDSVTDIGDYAFYSCLALESVTYGTGLTTIGSYAFAECSKLSKINSTDNGVFNLNGNGLKKIGKMAFNNANKATKIIVGKSVETIELGAFNGCDNLVSIELPFIGTDRNSAYSQSQVFGYIFGYETSNKEGLTMQYTNYYYYIPVSLREVVITDETVVSKNAFINCSMIESIIIKSDLTSIGDYAFYNCDGLKTITIESNTMPTISAYVFNGDSTVVIKVNSAILSDYQSDANWSKRTLEAIQ